MARREARSKDGDFLKRLFDEPADGKSPLRRPSKRSRLTDSRAQILAVLEAAGERLEEGVVLDDALLAAYLDGALATEEQVALEGLLARSADLRDQLAAAGEARAVALGGRAKMPKAFIEDFDTVPAPRTGQSARSLDTARSGILPRWLAAIAPGRSWAMAALPAILAVIVVAVIGPAVYGPQEAQPPQTIAGGVLADKDVKNKPAARQRRAKLVEKENRPRAGEANQFKKKPQAGLSSAGRDGQRRSGERVVASVVVPLDDDLRAALVRMGVRQDRLLSAAGSPDGRAGAKQEAAKPPAAKSFAPKRSAKIAEERKRRDAAPKTEPPSPSLRTGPRTGSMAQGTGRREQPSKIDQVIEKCERRRIDPKLLQRLLASGPPLQRMRVLHLSSKTCLLTLPVAPTGK